MYRTPLRQGIHPAEAGLHHPPLLDWCRQASLYDAAPSSLRIWWGAYHYHWSLRVASTASRTILALDRRDNLGDTNPHRSHQFRVCRDPYIETWYLSVPGAYSNRAGAKAVAEVLIVLVVRVWLLRVDAAFGIGLGVDPKGALLFGRKSRSTAVAGEVALLEDFD